MKNFNVKEMARDAVVNFFQDPETRKAFAESRETFAENLHQYRNLPLCSFFAFCPCFFLQNFKSTYCIFLKLGFAIISFAP